MEEGKELVRAWLDETKHGADRAQELIYFSDELIEFYNWLVCKKIDEME